MKKILRGTTMDINLISWPKHYHDIIYMAGRNCYGLENFSDIPFEKKAKFISNIVKMGHESVLEHVNVGIFITGCSRSFLAQITRHRLASFSVKSQHYVKHFNFKYKDLESDLMEGEYKCLMQSIDNFYQRAIEKGMPHYIAREVLPNSCLTNIYMTANIREWRHIINMRVGSENTPEIQTFAMVLLAKLIAVMPECFEDQLKYLYKKRHD